MVKGLLAAAVLLLVGCKSKPSIIGKWDSQSDASGVKFVTVTEYRADGTLTSISKSESTPNGSSLTVTDTGTWKLEGDRLSVILKDIDWKIKSDKPELIKKATDRFQQSKANLLAETNRIFPVTIKWNGNDEFEYTVKTGEKYIYRRQK